MGVSWVFRTLHNRGNMKGLLKVDISNFCEITPVVTVSTFGPLWLYGALPSCRTAQDIILKCQYLKTKLNPQLSGDLYEYHFCFNLSRGIVSFTNKTTTTCP